MKRPLITCPTCGWAHPAPEKPRVVSLSGSWVVRVGDSIFSTDIFIANEWKKAVDFALSLNGGNK